MAADVLLNRRILIVEDETMVALALGMLLESHGSIVIGPAGTADAAAALVEAEPPDAALLDVNLHGASAMPVADLLARRGVPFAFVTGYGAQSLPERYRDRMCLVKPCRMEALADAVRTLLAPPASASA